MQTMRRSTVEWTTGAVVRTQRVKRKMEAQVAIRTTVLPVSHTSFHYQGHVV